MRLKNIFQRIIQGVVLVVLLPGCTEWLAVEDVDKLTESQVFSSETNIQKTLNGIYLSIGANELYGRDLSVDAIELLGQQYALAEATADVNVLKHNMLNHNYTTETAKAKFKTIWYQAYNSILNINNFINMLNKTEGVISSAKKELLLGEVYGLRAYLHLDLLRLFGPIYLTDSTGISIPYRTETKIEYNERIAANEVMTYILGDLNRSIDLLKNDPITTLGVMAVTEDRLTAEQQEMPEFYRYRNRRLNYFAANALKVRVLMYRNDKLEAAKLAKTLLEASTLTEKFPWAENNAVFDSGTEDRIFSSEVLFGVHAANMYNIWTALFSPGNTDAKNLNVTAAQNMEKLYELAGSGTFSLCTDWRSKNWLPYTRNAVYMVSYKLAKSDKETTFWYYQPLIRKAELYYVLAECERDVAYIDEVRVHRGIKKIEDIRPIYDTDDEIHDEFRREMHNEGQMFFYYKRRNMSEIPSGSTSGTVSMTKDKYVIPVPDSEKSSY